MKSARGFGSMDRLRVALFATACMVVAPAQVAMAQTSPTAAVAGTTLPEVVVTAQKRSENLQDVPVAVTAVTDTALAAGGVHDIIQLNNVVPGLNFTTAIGIYGQAIVRGVGSSSHGPGVESPVATYIDGVYLVSPTSALMSMSDVAQVAVLKGPQGTLFGRNATGGLIQVTTKTPSHSFTGDVKATVGNLALFGQELYLNAPLGDTVAANLAVSHENQDKGFGRNLANGLYVGTHHAFASRAKVLWQPDDKTNVMLSADYSKRTEAGPNGRNLGKTIFGQFLPGGPWDLNYNTQPALSYEGWGTSLNFKHELEGVEFSSVTAYRSERARARFDADTTRADILEIDGPEANTQFSEELQLLSTAPGPFTWVTGLYFLKAEGKSDSISRADDDPGAPGELFANSKLTSYAAFAQGTYKIDDATNLTAGIRYSSDRRAFDSKAGFFLPNGKVLEPDSAHGTKRFSQPTYRVSLDHRFSPELMAYVSYNHGFRSGTFVPDLIPVAVLQPETLEAYETGFKADLADRRVRLNAAAYYYDYTNRQVQAVVRGITIVYPAPKEVTYGIDADLTAYVTENFSFTAGLSLLHAEYTDFKKSLVTVPKPAGGNNLFEGDATGHKLENTPDWTLSIGPTYKLPTAVGLFTASANYYYNDGWYAGPDNRLKQPSYTTVAADIEWVPAFNDNLSIRIWGRNLGNVVYAQQLSETGFGDNRNAGDGRSYGITLGAHF